MFVNKNLKAQDLNFGVGDMVKVSTAISKFQDKLKLVWAGPYLITEMEGDHLVTVTDLLDRTEKVHTSRLSLYDGPNFIPSSMMKEYTCLILLDSRWMSFVPLRD